MNAIEIVSKILGISGDKLSIDSKLGDFQEWDSLGHIQLMLSIEEQFGIQLTTSEMANLTSIRAIEDKIKPYISI